MAAKLLLTKLRPASSASSAKRAALAKRLLLLLLLAETCVIWGQTSKGYKDEESMQRVSEIRRARVRW